MTLTQCVYSSQATSSFREQDLPQLLSKAREANARVGVTGILLYIKGSFFQVLEGDTEAVEATYGKIAVDPRHRCVTRLVNELVTSRHFSDWTMAFETLEPVDAGAMIGDAGFFFDVSNLESLNAERARKMLAGAAAAYHVGISHLLAQQGSKIQSSKLEAMGTLAAGVAHDFNNILASILSHAELAVDKLEENSRARSHVEKVIGGCFVARDLIARMIDFARQKPGKRVSVNIAFQVRETMTLLRAALPPSIELGFESTLVEQTKSILADPAQITQIVMNLCINAAHAMNNRGVIGVRIDPAAAISEVPFDQRTGICITVADTGGGMTPAVMARIFDPFFTTKAPGEGSGLGLSVVHGIVQSLGGLIRVHSVDLGTTGSRFEVFLPSIQSPDRLNPIH
jgi:signal transduction histidine kinase